MQMQKHVQLAFTGYDKSNVESALEIIMKTITKKSSNLDIIIHGTPISQRELLVNQPPLHGCDHKDLTVIALSISGSLKDVKRLVETKTPRGVMVEVLPQAA